MIPTDLLSALRAKDPELWGKLQDQLKKLRAYQEGRVYEVDVIATFECLPQISGWILQGLLQDAIRARGWSYTLDCVADGPNKCGACVIFGPQFHNRCIRNADTEAEALLRAYLGKEVERLRSEREVWIKHYNDVLEANARIKELEAEKERLEAAFLIAYQDKMQFASPDVPFGLTERKAREKLEKIRSGGKDEL
jgi:hypothetical protein